MDPPMNSYDRTSRRLARLPTREEYDEEQAANFERTLAVLRHEAVLKTQPLTLRELVMMERDFQEGPTR